uniref:Uncharacterized protein n=1 Tax=Tetranychus urticae TaxID=32264 RepID=T1JXS0_TETUR
MRNSCITDKTWVIALIFLCYYPPLHDESHANVKGDFEFVTPYCAGISDSEKDFIFHLICTHFDNGSYPSDIVIFMFNSSFDWAKGVE